MRSDKWCYFQCAKPSVYLRVNYFRTLHVVMAIALWHLLYVYDADSWQCYNFISTTRTIYVV